MSDEKLEFENGKEIETVKAPEAPEKPSDNASKGEKDRYKRDMLRYKDEVAELREKIKNFELKEEEEKGNLTNVIEKLKNDLKTEKTTRSKERYNWAMSKVQDSVKTAALKLSCTDPDTFYKLIDEDDIKSLTLDENFNVDKNEIKDLVEKYSDQYKHLGFFSKKVNVVDRTPTSSTNFSKAKSLGEMTKDELLQYGKKLGHKTLK